MSRSVSMVLAWALVGCSFGETDVLAGGGNSHDAGAIEDAGVDTDGVAFEGGTELTGTWAQMLVYGTVFNLPAIGQTEGATTTIQRVTIVDDGTTPHVVAKACAVEIDNGTSVVETIIPNRFVDALQEQEPTTTVGHDESTMTYRQDRVLTLRGVKLDDPENGTLPTDASDPHIFDQDEDGHPGMTVLITGLTDGEVYVIQRDWYELAGSAQGPDWIDGFVEWNTEQVVLGSDNPILNAQTDSSPHPEGSRSYFRMTRVSENDDCESILAMREELFTR